MMSPPKYELWHLEEGGATPFSWMVWDVDNMEPHWFTNEATARRRLEDLRAALEGMEVG
jgi:hypothetical protein